MTDEIGSKPGIEKMRKDAVKLLRAVWKRLDWDKIDGKRRKTFQDEFVSKIKSATHTDSLQKFIDTLCRKLEIRSLSDKRVADVIQNSDHYAMLKLLREETIYLILIMRDEVDKNE